MILEGPYLTLHKAGLPLSACLELLCSKMKVEEAQWTVRKTETAISVSLFWPSFSADRNVNSSMASRRKRCCQHRQRKKSGKHITNLGPTVSEKKQNRPEAELGSTPINADSQKVVTSNTLQTLNQSGSGPAHGTLPPVSAASNAAPPMPFRILHWGAWTSWIATPPGLWVAS